MKKSRKSTFFIVLALIIGLTFCAFFGIDDYYGDKRLLYIKGANDIRWGIDIQGGVEAVFTPEIEIDDITEQDMQAARQVIENRLMIENITDYEIFVDDENCQVIVRFPWKEGESEFDPQKAVDSLGATQMLTFRDSNGKVWLKGSDDIDSAEPGFVNNGHVVVLHLTNAGRAKFYEATKANVGKTLSIYMDDSTISSPTVQEAINSNEAYITLGDGASSDDATYLAQQINAGSLPFAMSASESSLQIVTPTLGTEALNVMLIAGAIALALICILMIARYRLPGIVASIALIGQVAGMIAAISGFFPGVSSFTLTIPGIAGMILSIGIGVDCNVIASERIMDEFKKGKTIDGAINAGFKNSFSAILDGNVTVIIVSIVLMGAFGSPDSLMAKLLSPFMSLFSSSITGSIYSFGYTLLMGVVFNFLMGVISTRLMLKSISRFKCMRKPQFYGGAKNEK
ncbi:MAG: protein translocase subunit SecD [Ruminococcaceae bacterium]|nr:protein translocase subunit SecD [Oscillospiraceae bacterium]